MFFILTCFSWIGLLNDPYFKFVEEVWFEKPVKDVAKISLCFCSHFANLICFKKQPNKVTDTYYT